MRLWEVVGWSVLLGGEAILAGLGFDPGIFILPHPPPWLHFAVYPVPGIALAYAGGIITNTRWVGAGMAVMFGAMVIPLRHQLVITPVFAVVLVLATVFVWVLAAEAGRRKRVSWN